MNDTNPHGELSGTRWSAIEAGDVDYLVRRYWPAIAGFLHARLGDSHEAEEATQEFFLKVLDRDVIGRLDRTRGRARSFLFHLARQFLVDRYRARTVEERHRLAAGEGEDLLARQPAPADVADFDRHFFQNLCNEARRVLKAVFTRKDDLVSYRAFRLFHHGSDGDQRVTQDDVAAELGLTRTQVTNALRRTRRVYAQAIRDLLADACGASEVEDELRELCRCIEAHGLDAPPPSTFFQ